jgi:hypothetical protein
MSCGFFALRRIEMRSKRSLPALLCSFVLLFSLLAGPLLGVGRGKTPPPEDEAKKSKALMEKKAVRDAKQSLQGSKPQEMKLRGRNKPGDQPGSDDKRLKEGGKKVNPAD